ncbi:conjugative transposon protein TraN [Elizabethkingia ursingii]|uniref:Conjugative transposon protein TraN n=1 Tax=Elizabethkingia ursingii TaxID=1756150 RepID=A0AAJ3NA35_9FLAO|nr:conjugative transposon protein TraN [Elizabethkingia ursingii]AQX10272.1 conjugative transposon protein TraN [Elizabethkingia ursingii]OPB72400.1 conjugative transposon protein TraN [Elizabethkingia ursingii]
MKTLIKGLCGLVIFLIFIFQHLCAQESLKEGQIISQLEPSKIEVTYYKTSHLLFPSPICYVDLGSEYIMADKVKGAENILRVKASVQDFKETTNFSVITQDGHFYNFDVYYSSYPELLNYNIGKAFTPHHSNEVQFKELENSSASRIEDVFRNIYIMNRDLDSGIRFKNYGIKYFLKGLYIDNGKYFFHTEIENQSNVSFDIDYVNFIVTDKNSIKRNVVQQTEKLIVREYKTFKTVQETSRKSNIYALEKFTMAPDEVLLINVYEKNGARHLVLKVNNKDLIRAQLMKSFIPQD